MKNSFKSLLATLPVLMLPLVALGQIADNTSGELHDFGSDAAMFITTTLVPFVFAVSLLLFIYGVYLYFFLGKSEEDNLKNGKSYMIWAVLAFVIMVSVWGIVNLLSGGLGLQEDEIDSAIPAAGLTR